MSQSVTNKNGLTGNQQLIKSFISFLLFCIGAPFVLVLAPVLLALAVPIIIVKLLFVDMIRAINGVPVKTGYSLFNYTSAEGKLKRVSAVDRFKVKSVFDEAAKGVELKKVG